MFIIIGLGNPGDKYKYNRHNVGFLFVDYLKEKYAFNNFKKKKNFLYSLNQFEKYESVLLKPTTYMNLSGLAITSAMAYFKTLKYNLLIIYDDVALPLGKIRIRERGSDGGHNGLKNIRSQLGTEEYKRIRIGIGAPEYSGQMISHVLGDFDQNDLESLKAEIFPMVEEAVKLTIKDQIKEAMNRYNGVDLSEDKN